MDRIEREILSFEFNKAEMRMRDARNDMKTSLREYIKEVCRAKGIEKIDFNFETGYPAFINKALRTKCHISAVKVLDNVIVCLKGKEWVPMEHLSDIRMEEVMDSVEVYDKTVRDAV